MTWEEAKDQVMRNHDFIGSQWSIVFCEQYAEEAAQLYAREKADKAWDAGWGRCEQMWINSIKDKYKITAQKKEDFMKQLFPEK